MSLMMFVGSKLRESQLPKSLSAIKAPHMCPMEGGPERVSPPNALNGSYSCVSQPQSHFSLIHPLEPYPVSFDQAQI